MAISAVMNMCVEPIQDAKGHVLPRRIHSLAPFLDTLVGLALMTIGLLALYHVIPSMCSAAPYLIGAGAGYTAVFLFRLINGCKNQCAHRTFLIHAPTPGRNERL